MIRCFSTFLFLILISVSLLAEAEDQIVIGGAFGLSGPIATWGNAEQKGALLALEEFQKSNPDLKIKFVSEDTKGTSIGTVTAFHKLIDVNKAKYIVGSTWLDSFHGAIDVAKKKNCLVITPSASIAALNPSGTNQIIFSTYHRVEHQVDALLEEMSKRGIKTAVTLYEKDPWWQQVFDNFHSKSKKFDISVAKIIESSPGQTDFRAEIINIKKINPQIVFFGLNTDSSILSFLRQRNELKLESDLYSTESISDYKEKKEFLPYIKNIEYVAPVIFNESFSKDYFARFKETPAFSAPNSYDAMNLILLALDKGLRTPKEMANYFRNEKFQTTSFGSIGIDQLGGVTKGYFKVKSLS